MNREPHMAAMQRSLRYCKFSQLLCRKVNPFAATSAQFQAAAACHFALAANQAAARRPSPTQTQSQVVLHPYCPPGGLACLGLVAPASHSSTPPKKTVATV